MMEPTVSELPWLGVRDLARAVAAREISPVEVVRALLAGIERSDSKLCSYLAVFAEPALEAARRAEGAVRGRAPLGPLHGVPVALKDLFDVRGTPTTGGSSFLRQPARADAAVVSRLLAAGAILLGKLNLHEFAYGPEGINSHFGTPWNPWDPHRHRLPGGSSSGSGVAVAAGLAPVAMGTDTGGSIRIPAACCGIVGLKPTYGRVSRAGVLPLSWSLDHIGPLTRSVADAAAILSTIAGHDPADPTSSRRPVPDYAVALDQPVRGLRVGLLSDFTEQSDPGVQAAVRHAAGVLEDLGCQLEPVRLPRAPYAAAAAGVMCGAEVLAYHGPLLRDHVSEYQPDVRLRTLAGFFVSGADYVKAQQARRLIRDEVNESLGRVEVLLAPTLPIGAPPVGTTEVTIRGQREPVRSALLQFTRPFNVTGHPVLALPCGFDSAGMPVSMQLIGRAFGEETILRLGHAYEQATPWHARRPPEGIVGPPPTGP